ncbi:MAG: PIG-L family deacetylase [Vicinamibacterales bacterium]
MHSRREVDTLDGRTWGDPMQKLPHAFVRPCCALLVALAGATAAATAGRGSVEPGRPPAVSQDISLLAVDDLSSSARLLVVVAHPDDEVLGAGGLIARTKATGAAVLVVVVTSGDGFPEGVELEDRMSHPTPQHYRQYGKLREGESIAATRLLGLSADEVTFLGFPDGGLCELASHYASARGAFLSPYTRRMRPPPRERVIPGSTYRGIDVRLEIERIVTGFRPTVVVLPAGADEHPDHCSTYLFVKEALDVLAARGTTPPRLLQSLVHFGQWPLGDGATTGSRLVPPTGFPSSARWASLELTSEQAETKRRAILAHASQMLVIGRFLLGFARSNELFVVTPPTGSPVCWCNGSPVSLPERPR